MIRKSAFCLIFRPLSWLFAPGSDKFLRPQPGVPPPDCTRTQLLWQKIVTLWCNELGGGVGALFFFSPPLFGLKMAEWNVICWSIPASSPWVVGHSSSLELKDGRGFGPAWRHAPLHRLTPHSQLNGFPLQGPWLIPDAYSILRVGTVAETFLRHGTTTTTTTNWSKKLLVPKEDESSLERDSCWWSSGTVLE